VRALRALCFGLFSVVACVQVKPYGQVLVVVDTDAPVARLISRLRIDLYSPDAKRRYDSRTFSLLSADLCPATFTGYAADDAPQGSVLVRLRAYAAGRERPYQGECFAPRPSGGELGAKPDDPYPLGPCTPSRLLDAKGNDITPLLEPIPAVTIDRLALVSVSPSTMGSAYLILRGSCFGTMADLTNRLTCVDTENARVPVARAPIDSSGPLVSAGKNFGDAPCNAPVRAESGLLDEEVCIPGGAFLFGNLDIKGSTGDDNGTPEHVAVISPFRLDRWEVTVNRWRSTPFQNPDPSSPVDDPNFNAATDPFGSDLGRLCTYSTMRDPKRDSLPLNCVSRLAASAFCQSLGGDLPTEAQWEYVAQAVNRPSKTKYATGDGIPDCKGGVWGRVNAGILLSCTSLGLGPASETDPSADMSPFAGANGHGVMNLLGGVAEYVLDSFRPLSSNCWAQAPLVDPACVDPSSTSTAFRGGSYFVFLGNLFAGIRFQRTLDNTSVAVGFRCARPAR